MVKKRTPSFLKPKRGRAPKPAPGTLCAGVPVVDVRIESRAITTSRRSIPLPMGHATALAHAPNPEVLTHLPRRLRKRALANMVSGLEPEPQT